MVVASTKAAHHGTHRIIYSKPILFWLCLNFAWMRWVSSFVCFTHTPYGTTAIVTYTRIWLTGFLSTNSIEMPGNAGLLDVMLALQWIQKHIHAFGGDPTRVTIFGQSSGASMASALALSHAVSDHLFQRVIAQSGSALANWCYSRSPEANARDIARRAGLNANLTLAELHQSLSKLDLLTLLKATDDHYVCHLVIFM